MTDFIKGFIIIELFYYSEPAGSVFNKYTKFKTLILNIDCCNTYMYCNTIYPEKHFHAGKHQGTKLAINVIQLIIFSFLFLAFNLIITHLHLWGILKLSNI